MKVIKNLFFGIIIAGLFSACNNYFHDLIPPDDNRILSFEIDGQIDDALITNNTITVTIDSSADIHTLIPRVEISRLAAVIPVTLNYINAAFPGIDIVRAAIDLHTTTDLTEYVWNLIEDTPDFNIPVLDIPIDFSTTVNFLVVSAMGSIREYTVDVEVDSGLPHLKSFGFSKYENPELIHDAVSVLNESSKTIQSSVLYPAEMDYLSYELIPVFEILGDRIEVDGEEVRSGLDAIKFSQGTGTKSKIITVWRNDVSLDFELTAVFSEDPDSIRSIIDFRFNKANNPGIAVNAVASIINNDSLGTINAQVFYAGAKPSILTPRFISPGTVTVSGAAQVSGSSAHDFSAPFEYYVVSRNNRYVRTYTVFVEFIDVAQAAPVISSFRFSSALNSELVQDTQAQISEGSGHIIITAMYGGTREPDIIVPEFSATGLVRVNGAVQVSGFSAHNYSRHIKYTVSNPENPLFARDYWVQVTFIRDTSSDATIKSFAFNPENNPGLNDGLTGRIDQNAGKITIFAPVGSGVSARTMYPSFTAAGQVRVNETAQVSGSSGQIFETPVTYEVISANGMNRREYVVTVRELRSTIYVDSSATGEGDGSSWRDAFRNLRDACEAAAEFDEDIPKEIWIARGTYKPSMTGNREEYFLLTPNTSYIGGFAGNETSKSARNTQANPVVISGELGSAYSYNLFGSFNGNTAENINGDIIFENIEFTGARAQGSRNKGAAINALMGGGSQLQITRCNFSNFQSEGSGAALNILGGDIYVNNSNFSACSSGANNGIVYLSGSGSAEFSGIIINSVTSGGGIYNIGNSLKITDSKINNVTGTYGIYSTGGLEADKLELSNITGEGIYAINGAMYLSGITVSNISGWSVFFDSSLHRASIDDSTFDNCGRVFIGDASYVDVTNTRMSDIHRSGSTASVMSGIQAKAGGNIDIENVTIENVEGRGMYFSAAGQVVIIDSHIKDTKVAGFDNGGGIYLADSGSAFISGIIIENVEMSLGLGGGIYINNLSSILISEVAINSVSRSGIYLIGTGNAEISGVTINSVGAGGIGNNGYNLKIVDSKINNAEAGIINSSGRRLEIDTLELKNIPVWGIYYTRDSGNLTGDISLTGITASGIGGYAVRIWNSSSFTSSVNIDNSIFDDCGHLSIGGSGISSVQVTDTIITNMTNNVDVGIIINGPSGLEVIANQNVNIANVIIEDVYGRGMYIRTGGAVVINNSRIKNVKITGSGGGIYLAGSGTAVLSGVIIENAEATANGGGIYSEQNLTISGSPTVIKNVSAGGRGGAIYLGGSSNTSTISGLTIDNVTASGYGGGIYSDHNLTISGSPTVIKNVSAGLSGGAICLVGNYNTSTISGLTIDNTTTSGYGGGIYSDHNLTISGSPTVIKNVSAGYSGGAIYFSRHSSDPPMAVSISGLTIDNATADSRGGIRSIGGGSFVIEDSRFENVTARNNYKILELTASAIIRRCTFIHDGNYVDPGTPSVSSEMNFFNNTGTFEDCTFTNLRSNKTGSNFLFNRWSVYPSGSSGGGITGSAAGNLTLKNCTFNLGAGSAGIMALSGGQRAAGGGSYMKADELLMEGCTINYSGGQTPVIWLATSPQGSDESGTFRLTQNNKFLSAETGEITINNIAQVNNLVSRGIVLLENGAIPVLVP